MRRLVGRDAEIATLVELLDRAREGGGALALVTGEAGIGKSRLLDEVCTLARSRAVTITRARCWDGASPPFWPWLQVLRAIDEHAVPELGSAADPETRLAVFDRVATYLRGVARRAPLLVAIEDLHCADESSVLLLRYLAIDLSGARVLFVATSRADGGRELTGVAQRIALGGLHEDALESLVGSRLLSKEAMVRATAGNPLFALELASALARHSGGALPIPDTVRDVLGERLRALPETTQRMLALAALLGPPIDAGLVAELGALEASEVLAALATARDAAVLVGGPSAREPLVFRHDLLREVAASSIAGHERAELHLRAGALLERRAERAGKGLEAAAHHLLRALPLGSFEHAASRAAEVADCARDACAWETAIEWYEEALGALERGAAPAARTLQVLLSLAETRATAGAIGRAREDVLRAIELARHPPQPRELARAARVLGLGTVQRVEAADPVFLALVDESIVALGSDPEHAGLRATLLARRAAVSQPCAEYWRPHEMAREAIELARRMGTPRELLDVLDSARNAFRVVDDLDERVRMDEEQLALARALDAPGPELTAHRRLCVEALERGRVDDAREHALAVGRLGRRIGNAVSRWHSLQLEFGIAAMQGRFDDARAALSGADLESEAGRELFSATFLQAPTILLPFALARAEGDRAALQRFIEDPTLRPGARRLVLPHTRAWLGQRDEARADTLNLAAQGVSLATRVFERIALAEAAARLVMPDLARSVLDLLEPLAGRAVCWFPFGVCEGAFDRLRADLFRVLGDPARAIALYESALSLELRLGAKPWAARTRLGLAEALASPGATQDLERATALRGEAMETFDSLAMELDLERASAFVVDPPRSALAPLRAQERPPPSRPSLILDGEVWTIAHEGERGLLPDLDGLRYLAWLIDHPDVPTAAAELLALSRRGPGTSVLESSVETPLFDQKARAAYRERVADLRATLDEAEAMNDRGRVARAQHELDQLLEELGRASGLGGRDRALGASTERARVNVTLRLRKAIARIREVCPLLGEHLEASVRTGSTCRYSPSPPAR